MTQQPQEAEGSRVLHARVYFDANTGDIVRVHQVIESAGQSLGDEFVEEDLALVERSLRQHTSKQLDYVTIDPSEIPTEGVTRVNLENRRLMG